MEVKIKNRQRRIRINAKRITDLIQFILLKEGDLDFEVSILLVDDFKIRKLNKHFLGRDYPTDVLAFPIDQTKPLKTKPRLLGDIAISTQTALRNSKLYKNSPRDELMLYIIHGLLHLLGYGDITKSEKLLMKRRQSYYLKHLQK